MTALTPTRPTFFRSPAPAIPITTTQNTIGAIRTLMNLMKPSPSGRNDVANSGNATPSTMPSTRATTTWPNRDLKNFGMSVLPAPAVMALAHQTRLSSRAGGEGSRYRAAPEIPPPGLDPESERQECSASHCREHDASCGLLAFRAPVALSVSRRHGQCFLQARHRIALLAVLQSGLDIAQVLIHQSHGLL